MKVKVYVAGEDEFSRGLCEHISHIEDMEFVGRSSNGEEAIMSIKSLMPDVIITDILLYGTDGFGVLQAINSLPYRPKIIVISSMNKDALVEKAIKLGATYYMVKPVSNKAVADRIRELTQGEYRAVSNRSLDERISNIFISVGIPAHIKGYQFLREAIKLAVSSPDIINSITKKLYPSIADHFNTSSSKVERAIRHAIEVAWNRGKIENVNNLFGVKIYTAHDKPTNGEFIALIADKMLIEGA